MDQPETATTSEARPRTVAAESHRRSADGGGPRPADPLRSFRPLVILAGVALVSTVLYFGRTVLIPLALAGLLAFLLAPVTAALQRVGLGRVMSVVVVMVVLVAL